LGDSLDLDIPPLDWAEDKIPYHHKRNACLNKRATDTVFMTIPFLLIC